MRSLLMILSLVFLCSGCATLSVGPFATKAPGTSVPAELQLKLGMTQAEVFAIMDKPVTIGYEVDAVSGVAKPINSRSLFSTELSTRGNKSYQIDRYIVRNNNGVAVTAEDLLYPVVFERGLLVAKGRDGLEELKSR